MSACVLLMCDSFAHIQFPALLVLGSGDGNAALTDLREKEGGRAGGKEGRREREARRREFEGKMTTWIDRASGTHDNRSRPS